MNDATSTPAVSNGVTRQKQALAALRALATSARTAVVQQVAPVMTAAPAPAPAQPAPTPNPFAAAIQTVAQAVAQPSSAITAQHTCTDQANVVRMQANYGSKLLVVAKRFYYWTGTHWQPDDNAAARLVATLSRIIGAEIQQADAVVQQLKQQFPAAWALVEQKPYAYGAHAAQPGAVQIVDASAKLEALQRWSQQSEMTARQEACLGMLRKLIAVSADKLDRDPELLNCRNGTVDLRTGALRPHDPANYITHCAPVDFDPTAQAPRFEQFLQEIYDGDQSVIDFTRRWFGYCATGETREQKFLIHVGSGGNGKGVLLETLSKVLGDYASPAPPGFFTDDDQSRALSRNAEMFGRRLVTASESDERGSLNEVFIKAATGGDRLKGKFLYHDPFEFSPVHKLQLFTNGVPGISGTERGIWRRIMLVKYPHSWGSAAEVADGRAEKHEDNTLTTQLESEQQGIFTWLVAGAVEWYRIGLQVPTVIDRNTETYRSEQDRVGQFIRECCDVGPTKQVPVAALYSKYQEWCRESGYRPLGKGKFGDQLPRLVPQFGSTRKNLVVGGTRRSVDLYEGIEIPSGSAPYNAIVKSQ